MAVALGQVDLIRQKDSLAHDRFEKTAKSYPKSALAQFALGKSRLVRGMAKQALEPLAKAVALRADSAAYRKAFGRTLAKLEKWTQAEEELARSAQITKDGMTLTVSRSSSP